MNHPMHFDKVKPNTGALDMRALLDAPAGKHGFVEAKDGHLKARCEKKGLDFETENAKYLKKQAEKAAKKK